MVKLGLQIHSLPNNARLRRIVVFSPAPRHYQRPPQYRLSIYPYPTITQHLLHFAITFGRLTHMHYSHGRRMCIIIFRIISHHCRFISSRSSIKLRPHGPPIPSHHTHCLVIKHNQYTYIHCTFTGYRFDIRMLYQSAVQSAHIHILPFSTTCITNQHYHLSSFIVPGVYMERHS